jgi:hypothetical protein
VPLFVRLTLFSYKDKSSEIGKWLTRFFGLPFLAPDEVEDCFTDDIMSDAPDASLYDKSNGNGCLVSLPV